MWSEFESTGARNIVWDILIFWSVCFGRAITGGLDFIGQSSHLGILQNLSNPNLGGQPFQGIFIFNWVGMLGTSGVRRIWVIIFDHNSFIHFHGFRSLGYPQSFKLAGNPGQLGTHGRRHGRNFAAAQVRRSCGRRSGACNGNLSEVGGLALVLWLRAGQPMRATGRSLKKTCFMGRELNI